MNENFWLDKFYCRYCIDIFLFILLYWGTVQYGVFSTHPLANRTVRVQAQTYPHIVFLCFFVPLKVRQLCVPISFGVRVRYTYRVLVQEDPGKRTMFNLDGNYLWQKKIEVGHWQGYAVFAFFCL